MKTCWISATSYGSNLGTSANPFDGSTAEKFDALMRSFPADTRIRLLDGTFETTGSRNFNEDRGWFLKDGCHLVGNGPVSTTIKKVLFPTAALGASHAVIEMDYRANGGALVEGITIDENWSGFTADLATYAIHLVGSNCTIRNVWAKSGYGNLATKREAFTLGISCRFNGTVWEDNENALIEYCQVSGFKGDYGIAICCPGSPDAYGSMQSYVRCNEVTGYKGTAAFGASSRGLFENNVSDGCTRDYYTEGSDDVRIIGAKMSNTDHFSIHLTPVNRLGKVSNVMVENCEIDSSHVAVALSGVEAGRMIGIEVLGNKITGTGDAVNGEFVSALIVHENAVQAGMKSHFTECQSNFKGNTIIGVPSGLEDT